MSLKNLPIRYQGELHDIRLINFSIDKEEVAPLLPQPLHLRLLNGRALISLVDVQLKHMRPSFLPEALCFSYRHIAFRLLIADADYPTDCKGLYFLRSFTDKPLVALGGSIFTPYGLSKANIREKCGVLRVSQGDQYIEYTIRDGETEEHTWLIETVGRLDRAYFMDGGHKHMIRIQREKWPLEWVDCPYFETNFFKSARLEGAFRVKEMIPYTWMPAQKMLL